MYQVNYKIRGFEENFSAGPYKSYDETVYQRDDIAGFEGVYNVEIVPVKEDLQ